jgi:hypothetical protein
MNLLGIDKPYKAFLIHAIYAIAYPKNISKDDYVLRARAYNNK